MASDRFLTLPDVAEILNISQSQTYALVRSQDLKAIKIGGRGQWRVESAQLEEFIQRMYSETRTFVDERGWFSLQLARMRSRSSACLSAVQMSSGRLCFPAQ